MDEWILLGILAALSFGLSAIAAKISTSKDYLGMPATELAALTLIGVAVGFLAFIIFSGGLHKTVQEPKSMFIGVSVGLFWALGQVILYYALIKGADIARMAPIYNLNTLVVVILAVFILKEVPDKGVSIRIIFGAILITAGAVLVSI